VFSLSDLAEMTTCKLFSSIVCLQEIPVGIIESNDLSKITQLLLKDPKGHLYPVELVHRKYKKRSYIVAGWRDFYDSNSLEVGDVCIFTFKSGKQKATFQVEVMKSKANGH